MYQDDKSHVDVTYNMDWLNNLYDEYAPILYGMVVRMTADPLLSEKIMYKIYVEVWNNRASYHPSKERVFTWLNKIARRITVTELQSTDVPAKTVDQHLNRLIFNSQVQDCIFENKEIEGVDETDRRMLKLAIINGFTMEEIGSKLNLQPETVMSKIKLAAQKITGNNG